MPSAPLACTLLVADRATAVRFVEPRVIGSALLDGR